jgi:hypothetical protein
MYILCAIYLHQQCNYFYHSFHSQLFQLQMAIIRCNRLSRVGCISRQITSRHIRSSKFIPHSLLQSHNSQSHNYCHLQHHNYVSCWSHCHALDTTELVAAGLHWTVISQSTLIATDHTIGLLHVPDSRATTALSDFLIHTVSLLITDSLINSQSDNGKHASFPLRCRRVYQCC